jgi:hypothetical protein
MTIQQALVDKLKFEILEALHVDNRDITEVVDAAEAIAELWQIKPALARTIERAFILLGE